MSAANNKSGICIVLNGVSPFVTGALSRVGAANRGARPEESEDYN